MSAENLDWTRQWLAKAEEDLLSAQTLLDSGRPLQAPVCFHAQQCVEKALKAFLLLHGRKVDKTHDLGLLLRQCREIEPGFATWEDAAELLTSYAIRPRYPVGPSLLTRDLAAEALDLARQIRDFVLARVPLPPGAA